MQGTSNRGRGAGFQKHARSLLRPPESTLEAGSAKSQVQIHVSRRELAAAGRLACQRERAARSMLRAINAPGIGLCKRLKHIDRAA